jgi:hypothetical protein
MFQSHTAIIFICHFRRLLHLLKRRFQALNMEFAYDLHTVRFEIVHYDHSLCFLLFLQIYSGFKGGQDSSRAWLAIACFLLQNGADLNHKNQSRTSPIDEVNDPSIRNILLKSVKYVQLSLTNYYICRRQ